MWWEFINSLFFAYYFKIYGYIRGALFFHIWKSIMRLFWINEHTFSRKVQFSPVHSLHNNLFDILHPACIILVYTSTSGCQYDENELEKHCNFIHVEILLYKPMITQIQNNLHGLNSYVIRHLFSTFYGVSLQCLNVLLTSFRTNRKSPLGVEWQCPSQKQSTRISTVPDNTFLRILLLLLSNNDPPNEE